MHGANYDPEGSYRHDPIDDIEPLENKSTEYREAACKFIACMIGTIEFLRSARNSREAAIRLDLVSYQFNHPDVAGKSLNELGKPHSVTRANMSKHLLNYQRANNLPPVEGQKSVKNRKAYHDTREGQLS